MTFSRPAIERLITTVESGLKYGELGPYASALREVTAVLDDLRREVGSALGVEGEPDDDYATAAWTLAGEVIALRAEVARLTAERDGMMAIVDAVVRIAELDEICDAHPGKDDSVGNAAELEMYEVVKRKTRAVDAWRARKAGL